MSACPTRHPRRRRRHRRHRRDPVRTDPPRHRHRQHDPSRARRLGGEHGGVARRHSERDVTFVGAVNAADVDRHVALLPGVDARLQSVDAATGAIIVLVQGAERSMLTDRGANAELDFAAIPDRCCARTCTSPGIRWRHPTARRSLRSCAGRRSPVRRCRSVPVRSPTSRRWAPRRFGEVIAGADVLFASLVEGAALAGTTEPG